MAKPPSSRRAPRLWRDRKGVAALEFGVVAPVLLLLIAMTVSFGALMRAKMQVGNAARAGVVYVERRGLDNLSDPKLASVITGATSLAGVKIDPVPEKVYGCPNATLGVVVAAKGDQCASGGEAGQYVRVSAMATYPVIFPLPGFGSQVTLRASALARLD